MYQGTCPFQFIVVLPPFPGFEGLRFSDAGRSALRRVTLLLLVRGTCFDPMSVIFMISA